MLPPSRRHFTRSIQRVLAIAFATGLAVAPNHLKAQTPSAASVEARVEAVLSKLTSDEKIALLGGVKFFDIPGNARLGIPELRTADSPFGVRADGPSTVYPGGIGLAATWNPALAGEIGRQIGRDARARGRHYSLGPGVNMYRMPLNGRNFEYFGEDPFLASRLVVPFIREMQAQGVSATVKHFVGNESEYLRTTSDTRVDERTLREIYLPPFEAAVKEGDVGAVMPSYNLTNGTYMTANRELLVDLVKEEWGFRGVMMSDWGAVHSAEGAANGGTDLEMPDPSHFNRDKLAPLLAAGTVTQATIDDKVRRLLRNVVRFGWMDRPQLDSTIPRYNPQGRAVALQGAREAMVLLRNEGAILPLDRARTRRVAVIGPNAYPGPGLAGGSATIFPFHQVSPLEGIGDLLGTSADVVHARGLPTYVGMAQRTKVTTEADGGRPGVTVEYFATADLGGTPTETRVEPSLSVGRAFYVITALSGEEPDLSLLASPREPSMRRTGYFQASTAGAYDVFVQQSGFGWTGARLSIDGERVIDSWESANNVLAQATVTLTAGAHRVVLELHAREGGIGGLFARVGIAPRDGWVDSSAVQLAAKADVVVLAVGFDYQSEGEGWDRTWALPPGQESLIRAVTAANPRTIVVLNAGGGVDMRGWLDGAPAVIQAWYPGELGGRALAEVLFGDVNPSGHLPATFERRLEDNPAYAHYYPTGTSLHVPYAEGVFTGYRGYDRANVAPLFPFGFGLSYTTFRFANLTVEPATENREGEPAYHASFDVSNTGSRAGAVVAQLYVSDGHAQVQRPPKELKGFEKVYLQPGETRRLTLPLDLRSLAYFDAAGHQWRADAGKFTVRVGSSSADLPLSAPLVLPRTVTRSVRSTR